MGSSITEGHILNDKWTYQIYNDRTVHLEKGLRTPFITYYQNNVILASDNKEFLPSVIKYISNGTELQTGDKLKYKSEVITGNNSRLSITFRPAINSDQYCQYHKSAERASQKILVIFGMTGHYWSLSLPFRERK